MPRRPTNRPHDQRSSHPNFGIRLATVGRRIGAFLQECVLSLAVHTQAVILVNLTEGALTDAMSDIFDA